MPVMQLTPCLPACLHALPALTQALTAPTASLHLQAHILTAAHCLVDDSGRVLDASEVAFVWLQGEMYSAGIVMVDAGELASGCASPARAGWCACHVCWRWPTLPIARIRWRCSCCAKRAGVCITQTFAPTLAFSTQAMPPCKAPATSMATTSACWA